MWAAETASAEPAADLSPRELQVLELVAEGMLGPAIGTCLHISTSTVKTHLRSIYRKLCVDDRAAAVATAIRAGIIE